MEFLKSLAADGVEVQALKNRPQLEPWLRYYEDVFYDLSGDRTYTASGVPLAIPTSEIKAYCELFYIDSLGERERLFRMIRAADRKFVKVLSDKIKTDSNQNRPS